VSGARGFRRSVRELDRALDDVGAVAGGLRGTTHGDVRRAVRGVASTARQVADDPAALRGLVTNTATTMAALSADDEALGASVRRLAGTVATAGPAMRDLDRAVPATTALVKALQPALDRAPTTLRSATRLVRQVHALVRPAELGGVVRDLRPVAGRLPSLVTDLRAAFRAASPVVDCVNSNITPALKMVIDPKDGYPHVTGDPVWLELMHAFAGFSSIASSVDANGGNARLGLAGGEQALQGVIPGFGHVVSLGMPKNALGVRPTWLGYGVNPPYRPDAVCTEQRLPDLNKRSGAAPKWSLQPVAPRRGR
jgi:ABC-type transporter Mla subunit MlaD